MALISCPECKKEISDKAESCPQCGFKNSESNVEPKKAATFLGCGGLVWLLIIAVAIIIYIIGSISSSTGSSSSSTQTQHSASATPAVKSKNAENDLQLRDFKGKSEEYSSYIIGTIENVSDFEYSYAQVKFNLYDKNGNQVGSSVDNISNLEAHGKWKFKALVVNSESVKSFKFKEVTGF